MLSNTGERITLLDFTGGLCDHDFLNRVWIKSLFKENDYLLSDIVHFFFDDTHYAEQPEDHLGESLLNQEEVTAVRRMVVAFDTLLTACEGLGLTDAEYLRRPEWPAVHEAAKDLHALIVANDARIAAA